MKAALGIVVSALLLLLPSGSFAGEAPLTDQSRAEQAAKAVSEMRAVVAAVDRLVTEARNERDALRLNCVNERKAQIAGLAQVADTAFAGLQAALKERLSEGVDYEHQKIMIARSKVDGYKTEADQCIGLLAFYDSEEVERHFLDGTDTAGVDPTTPRPVSPTPYRPPPASPVQ